MVLTHEELNGFATEASSLLNIPVSADDAKCAYDVARGARTSYPDVPKIAYLIAAFRSILNKQPVSAEDVLRQVERGDL